MEYRRRIEAEASLYCIDITHTDCHDYITFLTKKVKFIIYSLLERSRFIIDSPFVEKAHQET